jgi:hypothetical protein
VKYSFTINEDDYYEFNKYHLYNSPYSKRRMMFLRIFPPVVFIAIAIYMGPSMGFKVVSYMIYTIFFTMALVHFLFYKKSMNRTLKRNIKKLRKTGRLHYESEITYEFLEDTFIETTHESESVTKYSMIERVSTGPSAFYLYTSVQVAHIVPFRVFANDSEREAFFSFIQSKVKDMPGDSGEKSIENKT